MEMLSRCALNLPECDPQNLPLSCLYIIVMTTNIENDEVDHARMIMRVKKTWIKCGFKEIALCIVNFCYHWSIVLRQ